MQFHKRFRVFQVQTSPFRSDFFIKTSAVCDVTDEHAAGDRSNQPVVGETKESFKNIGGKKLILSLKAYQKQIKKWNYKQV